MRIICKACKKIKACASACQTSPSDQTPQKTLEPIDRFTRLVAWFTGGLVLIGGLNVWAFIQSEKSFLSVKFDPLGLEAGKPIEIGLTIHNSGHSEAMVMNFITNLHLNKTLPQVPDYRTNTDPIISPPIERDGTTKITFSPIVGIQAVAASEDQVRALNSRQLNLYVFGFIRYKDAFTPFGSTVGFCAVYKPPHGSIPPTWETCQENSYTYAN